MTDRHRLLVFLVTGAVVVLGLGGYLLVALIDRDAVTADHADTGVQTIDNTDPYIGFRSTAVDQDYGSVALTPLEEPGAEPQHVDLSCERISMSSEGGICLAVDRRAVTTAEVLLLDADMSVRHRLSTPGIPSRARVSPDGSWAATTTFVTGHSYADSSFSTQTEIYDVAAGTSLGNVEDFSISRDGEDVTAIDVNVWGVTFHADSDTFYATVKTGGDVELSRGSISGRTVQMLGITAECPSLSPSGEQFAYKAVSGPGTWEVRVQRLDDGSEAVISESRSVDDQIEWLDESTVVYGLGREGEAVTDIWAAAADGSGEPELLVPGGWSPTVVGREDA